MAALTANGDLFFFLASRKRESIEFHTAFQRV